MTILNESGIPEVLSPLHAVGSLAERLTNALIVVVGTRSEAYLAQSFGTLDSVGPGAHNPRIIFMILDPGESLEEGQMASQLVEAIAGADDIELALVVSGRSAALMGIDVDFETQLVARHMNLPVKSVSHESEAAGCLCTDLEDSVLAGLVEICPGSPLQMEEIVLSPPKRGFFGGFSLWDRIGEPAEKLPPVVLVGAFGSPQARRELTSELFETGIEVAGSVPAREGGNLPPIDEGTVVAFADPFLSATARAVEDRGAKIVRSLSPVGADGTARFIQDVAAAIGHEYNDLVRPHEARTKLEHLRSRIRGKRIFFAGDTGLELPLARFLADAGAVILEVGAPRLDRKAMGPEIQALGSDVDVVEAPDWRGQIGRVDAARPDIVIASPGLYVPLVARGHLCRSSVDLLKTGIHGYEGARRILELLIRALDRADALDSVNL
ncbi:ferredoxin:protochlorophyllide reductase (ATP-dependent) subunit N [soil metagenome]